MKRYRLLKDLPGCGAGTIFCYRNTAFYHEYATRDGAIVFAPDHVEIQPSWFEEVKEDPFKGMTASEAIKYIDNSVGFKPHAPQIRRKAPAYLRLGGGDWEVSCCMYDSYEAACRDYEIEEVVGWPALPDKDGYYPGPK